MDSTLIAAIPGTLVALAALATFFVRTTASSTLSRELRTFGEKIDAVKDDTTQMRADMRVAVEHQTGEIGKLDLRIQQLEKEPRAYCGSLRP